MRKHRRWALVPVVVGVSLASAAPAFADFVCPVLPVSGQGKAQSNAGFIDIADGDTSILPGLAGDMANSPVDVQPNATNRDGAGSPGGDHVVPGDSDYTAIWDS